MLNLQTIHKPTTVLEALKLLAQPGAAILAGGTNLNAEKRRDVEKVVDVSALNLSFVETRNGDLAIGATTTLARAAESDALRGAANGVVALGAERTHASILRNQATAAGTLIVEPDGIFAVALSALEAQITRAFLENDGVGEQEIGIADFFKQRKIVLKNALLIKITLPASSVGRRAKIETVARTPFDKPIVSVCAALELENGIVRAGAVAVGGVDDTAWRARDAERELLAHGLTDEVIDRAAMAATSGLNPRGDYRGSAEYRVEMVRVLTGRTLGALRA